MGDGDCKCFVNDAPFYCQESNHLAVARLRWFFVVGPAY